MYRTEREVIAAGSGDDCT